MKYYLYRHPLYDDEKGPILIGEFKDYKAAERHLDNIIDDDWYFYTDFYIVDDK